MNKLVKSKRLTELEGKALIGLGLAKTGMADSFDSIKTIKDEKLYKETHSDFGIYIIETFGFNLKSFYNWNDHFLLNQKVPKNTTFAQSLGLNGNIENKANQWEAVVEFAEAEEIDPKTLTKSKVEELVKTIDITPEGQMVVKLPEMPKLPAVLNNYDVQNTESEVGNIIYNISTAINFFDVRPQEFRDWLNGYANFLEAKEAQNG